MIARQLTVKARLGLHARAAARLVRVANGFESRIVLRRLEGGAGVPSSHASNQGVDAKSILSVLMLAATYGTLLEASAEGADEEAAMNAIDQLFADAFGEGISGSAK